MFEALLGLKMPPGIAKENFKSIKIKAYSIESMCIQNDVFYGEETIQLNNRNKIFMRFWGDPALIHIAFITIHIQLRLQHLH